MYVRGENMMVDTELNLFGKSAVEFHKMMTSVDLTSMKLRDEFISGVRTELDGNGALVIDCPELDIDMKQLNNREEVIESVIIPENGNKYIDNVSVTIRVKNVGNSSNGNIQKENYKNGLYVSAKENSISQEDTIIFAA